MACRRGDAWVLCERRGRRLARYPGADDLACHDRGRARYADRGRSRGRSYRRAPPGHRRNADRQRAHHAVVTDDRRATGRSRNRDPADRWRHRGLGRLGRHSEHLHPDHGILDPPRGRGACRPHQDAAAPAASRPHARLHGIAAAAATRLAVEGDGSVERDLAPTTRGPDGKQFRFHIEARVEPHIKIADEAAP